MPDDTTTLDLPLVSVAAVPDPAASATTTTITTTEPAKPAEPVAIVYDLKDPEGSTPDGPLKERIVALAKAQGLSQVQAQSAYETAHALTAATVERALSAHTATVTGWKDATLADPALGATVEARKAAVATGQKWLTQWLVKNPDLAPAAKDFLEGGGFGSHPFAVRLLADLGARGAEGTVHTGGQAAGEKSKGQILYPNMNP